MCKSLCLFYPQSSVLKRYQLVVSKNGRSYREQVLADPKKKTEIFCQGHEMDRCIIYDFLKVCNTNDN